MNTRSYAMTERTKLVERTRERILDAAQALFAERYVSDFSLQEVAEQSEVTVQTILRHFGSKDGLLQAGLVRVMAVVEHRRQLAPEGDVQQVVYNLSQHYEEEGRLSLNMLAQQHLPYLREAAEHGRKRHRQWIDEKLGASISATTPASRRLVLDELCAVTDVYVWKLFRLDWGRSRKQTANAMLDLVRKVLAP